MKNKLKVELRGFWPRQNDDVCANEPVNEQSDEGYLLIGAIVAIFLVMLVLGIAAGSVAKQLRREREVEAVHRGNEYVRAIRVYYRKNGNRYPSSVEQLENTNNQRFLRQRFLDPLTGKDDWRLIHVGENQTTVKGFFGDDLPGLPTGLGAAAGLVSPIGGGSTTATAGTGAPTAGTFGTPATGTAGTTAAGATGAGATTGASTGFGSSSIGAPTGGGGLVMGVGSSAQGPSTVVVNAQETYDTWEFLYDPRIEQLYAKASLFGGGITSGAPAAGTLPAVPTGMPGAPGSTGTTPTPTPPPPS